MAPAGWLEPSSKRSWRVTDGSEPARSAFQICAGHRFMAAIGRMPPSWVPRHQHCASLRVGERREVSLLWRRSPSAGVEPAHDEELCPVQPEAVVQHFSNVGTPGGMAGSRYRLYSGAKRRLTRRLSGRRLRPLAGLEPGQQRAGGGGDARARGPTARGPGRYHNRIEALGCGVITPAISPSLRHATETSQGYGEIKNRMIITRTCSTAPGPDQTSQAFVALLPL